MSAEQRFIHRPKHITQMKNVPANPGDDSYAMDYSELEEILNKVCTELRLPVTVLNVKYPIPDEDKESFYENIRVDSAATHFSLRAPCRNLQNASASNGSNVCYECDYYYAAHLNNIIEESKIEAPVPSIIDTVDHYIPPIKECDGVSYIQYRCEMLGYIELCFAIKVYGSVLGVLSVGNTIINDKTYDKELERFRKNFIQRLHRQGAHGIFNGYDQTSIVKYILIEPDYNDTLPPIPSRGLSQPPWDDYRMPRTPEEFEEYIRICCKKVKEIENQIQASWEARQRNYFRDQIKNAESGFESKYDLLRGKEDISYDDFQRLYESIWDFALEIKHIYDLEYCRVFGKLPFIRSSFYAEQYYKMKDKNIGDCPYEKVNSSSCKPDFTAIRRDFSKANLNSFECRTSLEDTGENNPLPCFTIQGKPLEGENEVVLACSNLAMIFGIKTPQRGPVYRILFKEIANEFALICSKLQEVTTAFLKFKYYSTLTLYKHECVHYAKRIQSRNRVFYDRERYELLSDEKKKHIYDDLSSVAASLTTLADNISILLDNDIKRYTYLQDGLLDIIETISKWNALFRVDLVPSAKRIVKSFHSLTRQSKIRTNTALFDTLLLNIVDNAVKYSFFGTFIEIDVVERKGALNLIITDYGAPIDNSLKPYDLFYRADHYYSNIVGDGIGLYTSKRICEMLCLNLSHRCEKMYDFNVPFLFAAKLKGLDLGNKYMEKQRIIEEMTRRGELRFVAIDDIYGNCRLPPSQQIIDQIDRPIYKVSFIIEGLERG